MGDVSEETGTPGAVSPSVEHSSPLRPFELRTERNLGGEVSEAGGVIDSLVSQTATRPSRSGAGDGTPSSDMTQLILFPNAYAIEYVDTPAPRVRVHHPSDPNPTYVVLGMDWDPALLPVMSVHPSQLPRIVEEELGLFYHLEGSKLRNIRTHGKCLEDRIFDFLREAKYFESSRSSELPRTAKEAQKRPVTPATNEALVTSVKGLALRVVLGAWEASSASARMRTLRRVPSPSERPAGSGPAAAAIASASTNTSASEKDRVKALVTGWAWRDHFWFGLKGRVEYQVMKLCGLTVRDYWSVRNNGFVDEDLQNDGVYRYGKAALLGQPLRIPLYDPLDTRETTPTTVEMVLTPPEELRTSNDRNEEPAHLGLTHANCLLTQPQHAACLRLSATLDTSNEIVMPSLEPESVGDSVENYSRFLFALLNNGEYCRFVVHAKKICWLTAGDKWKECIDNYLALFPQRLRDRYLSEIAVVAGDDELVIHLIEQMKEAVRQAVRQSYSTDAYVRSLLREMFGSGAAGWAVGERTRAEEPRAAATAAAGSADTDVFLNVIVSFVAAMCEVMRASTDEMIPVLLDIAPTGVTTDAISKRFQDVAMNTSARYDSYVELIQQAWFECRGDGGALNIHMLMSRLHYQVQDVQMPGIALQRLQTDDDLKLAHSFLCPDLRKRQTKPGDHVMPEPAMELAQALWDDPVGQLYAECSMADEAEDKFSYKCSRAARIWAHNCAREDLTLEMAGFEYLFSSMYANNPWYEASSRVPAPFQDECNKWYETQFRLSLEIKEVLKRREASMFNIQKQQGPERGTVHLEETTVDILAGCRLMTIHLGRAGRGDYLTLMMGLRAGPIPVTIDLMNANQDVWTAMEEHAQLTEPLNIVRIENDLLVIRTVSFSPSAATIRLPRGCYLMWDTRRCSPLQEMTFFGNGAFAKHSRLHPLQLNTVIDIASQVAYTSKPASLGIGFVHATLEDKPVPPLSFMVNVLLGFRLMGNYPQTCHDMRKYMKEKLGFFPKHAQLLYEKLVYEAPPPGDKGPAQFPLDRIDDRVRAFEQLRSTLHDQKDVSKLNEALWALYSTVELCFALPLVLDSVFTAGVKRLPDKEERQARAKLCVQPTQEMKVFQPEGSLDAMVEGIMHAVDEQQKVIPSSVLSSTGRTTIGGDEECPMAAALWFEWMKGEVFKATLTPSAEIMQLELTRWRLNGKCLDRVVRGFAKRLAWTGLGAIIGVSDCCLDNISGIKSCIETNPPDCLTTADEYTGPDAYEHLHERLRVVWGAVFGLGAACTLVGAGRETCDRLSLSRTVQEYQMTPGGTPWKQWCAAKTEESCRNAMTFKPHTYVWGTHVSELNFSNPGKVLFAVKDVTDDRRHVSLQRVDSLAVYKTEILAVERGASSVKDEITGVDGVEVSAAHVAFGMEIFAHKLPGAIKDLFKGTSTLEQAHYNEYLKSVAGLEIVPSTKASTDETTFFEYALRVTPYFGNDVKIIHFQKDSDFPFYYCKDLSVLTDTLAYTTKPMRPIIAKHIHVEKMFRQCAFAGEIVCLKIENLEKVLGTPASSFSEKRALVQRALPDQIKELFGPDATFLKDVAIEDNDVVTLCAVLAIMRCGVVYLAHGHTLTDTNCYKFDVKTILETIWKCAEHDPSPILREAGQQARDIVLKADWPSDNGLYVAFDKAEKAEDGMILHFHDESPERTVPSKTADAARPQRSEAGTSREHEAAVRSPGSNAVTPAKGGKRREEKELPWTQFPPYLPPHVWSKRKERVPYSPFKERFNLGVPVDRSKHPGVTWRHVFKQWFKADEGVAAETEAPATDFLTKLNRVATGDGEADGGEGEADGGEGGADGGEGVATLQTALSEAEARFYDEQRLHVATLLADDTAQNIELKRRWNALVGDGNLFHMLSIDCQPNSKRRTVLPSFTTLNPDADWSENFFYCSEAHEVHTINVESTYHEKLEITMTALSTRMVLRRPDTVRDRPAGGTLVGQCRVVKPLDDEPVFTARAEHLYQEEGGSWYCTVTHRDEFNVPHIHAHVTTLRDAIGRDGSQLVLQLSGEEKDSELTFLVKNVEGPLLNRKTLRLCPLPHERDYPRDDTLTAYKAIHTAANFETKAEPNIRYTAQMAAICKNMPSHVSLLLSNVIWTSVDSGISLLWPWLQNVIRGALTAARMNARGERGIIEGGKEKVVQGVVQGADITLSALRTVQAHIPHGLSKVSKGVSDMGHRASNLLGRVVGRA